MFVSIVRSSLFFNALFCSRDDSLLATEIHAYAQYAIRAVNSLRLDRTEMASTSAILTRNFEETSLEIDNKQPIRKVKALRIALLILASIILVLNNALYVLYVPLVIVQYSVVSNSECLNYYGLLYASKDIALLLASPFIGALVDRVGYTDPLLTGIGFMLLSSVIFAFGESYWLFFTNRVFQGLNSAFADISIMVLTAVLFQEHEARTKAFGTVLGCTTLGFLVASPFVTAIRVRLFEERSSFLVFDMAYIVVGLLMFILLKQFKDGQTANKPQPIPMWRLLIDPYVLICAGSLAMSQVVLSFLQHVLPFWREGYLALVNNVRMTSSLALFSHISGIVVSLLVARKYPHCRWLTGAWGLTLEGICGLILPFVSSYVLLLIATCGITFAVALIRVAILPTLARIADSRHVSVYGSMFAISYMSYAVVDIAAPIALYNLMSHTALMPVFLGIAVSNILYAPVLYFLRKIY